MGSNGQQPNVGIMADIKRRHSQSETNVTEGLLSDLFMGGSMNADQFVIEWNDNGRWPTEKSNSDFPAGTDCDLSLGVTPSCQTRLPYPAKRCGFYTIRCKLCGIQVAVTTAGRRDDPCSVRMACKAASQTETVQ